VADSFFLGKSNELRDIGGISPECVLRECARECYLIEVESKGAAKIHAL
jgi:hypothetical protein